MKYLFNDGWEFAKTAPGTELPEALNATFYPVRIPHDWLIYQGTDLYEDSTGWYRKVIRRGKEYGHVYQLYFEGVYMDSTVYVNRKKVGDWKYGYSSFRFDITDALESGDNEILVQVRFRSPNSRWYSGAGIYRNVYLIEQEETRFVPDSFYVSARPAGMHGKMSAPDTPLNGIWELKVSGEILGLDPDSEAVSSFSLQLQVPELDICVTFPLDECMREVSDPVIGGAEEALPWRNEGEDPVLAEVTIPIEDPLLWSVEDPHLYMIGLSLQKGGRSIDRMTSDFGFRSIAFTPDKGFFLNGQHMKLNGVCEHHDLGALGAAYSHGAMTRKLMILKEMGVNAIRTAHNMPATDFLEMADKMGFLVVDEAFDMWRRSKTEYDYARFFPEWQARDVASWIRRDRNHPCIILWSIGNEIYDTHADEMGQVITKMLMEEARSHDPYHNAEITIGSNYMPWEGAQKCADILKLAGYNYGEKCYEAHHALHPDWCIFGSETSSTVQSRGIYHFPLSRSLLADDDEQCSCLGNSTTSWGAPNPEYVLLAERDTPFSAGQFIWSGFDYVGEPTPYSTRNSYFGQIDTAGFPKDTYYIYKSMWVPFEKEPFVHLFPYWDFNPGQTVDVRIASNAPEVELFVNGVSRGRVALDHAHGKKLLADYSVVYEPGEIMAVAYGPDGAEAAREIRHSFGEPDRICLERFGDCMGVMGNGEDLIFVVATVVDRDNYPVENANNLIHVKVQGAGYLTGLDNGDSTDTDEYKGKARRLFNGKLLIIARSDNRPGALIVEATSQGLHGSALSMQVMNEPPRVGRSYETDRLTDKLPPEKLWIRKIELTAAEHKLTADRRKIRVKAKVFPENADFVPDDLIWKVVTDTGIESPIGRIASHDDDSAIVEALGDGTFRVRCMTRNGARAVKVISQLEFTAEGLGQALLDPYGFVAGGMYSYGEGDLGNGNEHGVSSARDARSVIGFDYVNFGDFGSDEITLPIFELGGDPTPIQIWEGIPEQEGSELLADVVYHKPSIWNTYQPETYRLKRRIKGVTTICFVFRQKVHLKGFSFTKPEKAYALLTGADAERVYGDSFTREDTAIRSIGNNVTVDFGTLDFGDAGAASVRICGSTPNEVNTIHLLIGEGESGRREILEFPGGSTSAEFPVAPITGAQRIQLVFLPGSNFNLESIQFFKA